MSNPPNWQSRGYGDNRRPLYPYESYKPKEKRNNSRDRDRDRDRDRSRDRAPSRRESREFRDPRDTRPERSPVGMKKLNIDTRVKDGQARSGSLNDSPASIRSGGQSLRPTPTEPLAEKGTRSNIAPNSATMPGLPKANNPDLQDTLESIFRCSETSHEIMRLKLQKDKLTQEEDRRRLELGKVGAKADDYAPYSEFRRRFDESDGGERSGLEKRLKNTEQQYLQDLERVVSSLSLQKTQPAATAKTPPVSTLEIKFGELQKQVSESQSQIQSLLGENRKSDDAFNALQTEFKALKSKHDILETENSNLKQQLADVKLDIKGDISRVESLATDKASSVDLTQITSELRAFETRIEGQAGQSDKIRGNVDQLSEQVQSSARKQIEVEGKLGSFAEMFADFDMDTYNEMVEAWNDRNLINQVSSLRQDVQSLQQQYGVLFQEMKRDIGSLQKSHSTAAATSNQVVGEVSESRQTAFSDEHVHKLIEKRLERFSATLNANQDEMIEFCGSEIDEIKSRVDRDINGLMTKFNALEKQEVTDQLTALHAKAKVLETSINDVSPLLDSDILARITSLESQATTHQPVSSPEHLTGLDVRIKSIEENKFGFRIDRIEIDNRNRLLEFKSSFDSCMAHVDQNIKDALQRIEALNLSVRTLDSQWSNLSTKQMAEKIIQYANPYGQQVEARITGVENSVQQLKAKIGKVEEEVISWAKDIKDLVQDLPPSGKRPASPSQLPDEQAKKRKIETNGRYNPSPVLRSNSNGYDANS
ncbi:hypothetical protein F5B20DRAFT_576610 [Whalleya microplaca]|nr:hypothetical protein F5B20DRAFT_576610 [Whalleya microplaca]